MFWSLPLAFATEPPPARTDAPVEHMVFATAVLSNDMRVVVTPRPAWRTISIATVIDGGLVAEPRAGLSHALADSWLASNPTGHHAVSDLYDRLGAQSQVRVEPESTVFWVHGPAESTEVLLALEKQRFTDPLARLRVPAAPTRPTAQEGFTAKYLEGVYASLFPEPHPYREIWHAPSSLEVPLHAAADFAAATWTPHRTTMVVAGPVEPSSVLCALDPEHCGAEARLDAVEAAVELPDPSTAPETYDTLPAPLHADVGPLSAGVPAPVVLLSWSLPGLDSGARQLSRFARDRVEADLRDWDVPGALSRCHLFEGRVNTALICVLRADASSDLRRVRRRIRRGWSTRDLASATQSWRETQAVQLLGATGDAEHVPRIAEYLHRSETLSVHAGELDDLAFDSDDVERFLNTVLSDERLSVVRLIP